MGEEKHGKCQSEAERHWCVMVRVGEGFVKEGKMWLERAVAGSV